MGVVLTALLGTVSAVVDAAALLLAAVRPAARAVVLGRVVALESARLAQRHGSASDRRTMAFLAIRTAAGLVGGLLLVAGLGTAAVYTVWPVSLLLQDRIGLQTLAVTFAVGLAVLALSWQLSVVLVAADRRAARWFLGPDPRAALEQRVAQLSTSRAGVVDAVDEERRRIERDLHDGLQQNLVALGMLLGRARRSRDEEQVRVLVGEAHEQAGHALTDLRDLVWRVYPASLDQDGLLVSVQSLAARMPVPVHVHADLSREPSAAVARAAYFTVSEALSNAAQHADAARIDIHVGDRDGRLVVRITDDGNGGADPAGGGLSGLSRRVSAVDGTLTVRSPGGGPTEIVAVLPCE